MTASEEVLQAHLSLIAAHNAGDTETMAKLQHPQYTLFHAQNGLRFDNLDQATMQAFNEAGYRGQINSHNTDVKVFSNCAIITCYVSGMFTWAGGGGTEFGAWRYTSVWSKEGEAWQCLHAHISPLAPRQRTV